LTIAVTLVLVLGCSVEQVVPILVSSLVAWCMTGGLEWWRCTKVEEQASSNGHEHASNSIRDNDDQRGDDSVINDNFAANDEEILRRVRATIFGSV
jgi:hypothetical protein